MFKNLIAGLAGACAISASAWAAGIAGQAEVIDGDTLLVAGTEIDLWGIDAPERDETCLRDGEPFPCGRDASGFLRRLLGPTGVRCDDSDPEVAEHGVGDSEPAVLRCYLAFGDLAQLLVEAGLAKATVPFYREAERTARTERKGIWADHRPPGPGERDT